MELNIPNIHQQLKVKEVNQVLENNFGGLVDVFFKFQTQWLNSAYKSFNDLEKYLILIHLVKKTLDFYTTHFVKLSFDQYYYKKKVDIENFNAIDVSKILNIPKESTRRKILELEQSGVLLKLNQKLSIDRSAFNFQELNLLNSIKNISQLLSLISKILVENKILENFFNEDQIHKYIQKNFTYCWKIFFEMHIPILVNWKNFHGNLETFFIFGTCVSNHQFELNKKIKKDKEIKFINRKDYINKFLISKEGINAMSIADITGIPRTTVVRKLNKLVKKKLLNKDNKKLYFISKNRIKELTTIQTEVIKKLSIFTTKILNGMVQF